MRCTQPISRTRSSSRCPVRAGPSTRRRPYLPRKSRSARGFVCPSGISGPDLLQRSFLARKRKSHKTCEVSLFPPRADGYRVQSIGNTIVIAGNDPRGVLFGAGWLLRQLRMERDTIESPDSLKIATAPKYPLRGHQLGYRPKTNSYDGWSVAGWERYIGERAVFGR